MGLFDTFLDQVTGAGGEVSGEGGGFLDNLGGLFGGNDNQGEGGGGEGFLSNLGGLFGGNDNANNGDGGEGEGGGGFLDNLGGLFGGNDNANNGDGGEGEGGGGFLDNLGGLFGGNDNQGEGGGLFDGLVDRVSSYLPEELQDVAGNFLGNGDAPATSAAPNAPAPQPGEPAPATQVDSDDIVNTGIVPPHLNGSENYADTTMAEDAFDTYRPEVEPDNPTFVDDGISEPAPAPVLVDELSEVAPVEIEPEPMDDFEQTIHEADQIEDSFDAMFEGLG